jgi:hypothetical protein
MLLVTPLAMHKTMSPMLLVANSRTLLLTHDKTWELNPHQCKPTTLRAVNVNVCETKWK